MLASTVPSPTDIAAAAYLVALATQLTKWWLDYIIKPGAPHQNDAVGSYVVFLAMLYVVANRNAVDGIPITFQTVWASLGDAIAIAGAAIVSFHLLTGNLAPEPSPPIPTTPVQPPPP